MPHTIAENLARLAAARTAIAGAITAKGGTVAVDDGLEDFPTDIATIPSEGGGGESAKDVIFYDYDGTIVNSYSKTDFLALSAMPENPSHEGLTAQGWNWSLADAKAYVTEYRRLNIGQTYTTSDGKTRIKIKLEAGRLSPVLGLGINGSVDVDWGDGTAHGTMTGNDVSTLVQLQHVYVAAGEYTIALTVTGSIAFLGDGSMYAAILRKSGVTSATAYESQVYQNAVQELYIGNGVTSIKTCAFYNCYSLASVTIPNSVTLIEGSAFYNCYQLVSVTIPNSVTLSNYLFSYCSLLVSVAIPNSVTSIPAYIFNNCKSLASVTIPNSATSIGNYAFQSCCSLVSINIPNSVTDIGTYAFNSCYSLTSVTLPNNIKYLRDNVLSACYSLASVTIPNSVTSITSSVFSSCYSLTSVNIPNKVTFISTSAFNNCRSLMSVNIPNSVTSLGTNAFQGCSSLASVNIPNDVTTISSGLFNSCYSLASITISNKITSLASTAFQNCYSLAFIKFERNTPPSVSKSNTFASVPTDCIIYVPKGTLSSYTTATNYPDPNTYTYIEY